MRRLFFFSVIYPIISAVVITLSLEALGHAAIHLRYGIPGKSYGLWIYDPELGATHRPNGYNTHTSLNNYGFRNREDVPDSKPPHSLRIIAFGGSTTFGYNLADGETFPEQLERRLRQLPGYENSHVLNAGRINYSAGHNFILMKRLVPKLKPDYVILYEGINEMRNAENLSERDGVSLDELGDKRGVMSQHFDQNRWLKRNSVLVRFLDYRIKGWVVASRERVAAEREALQPVPNDQKDELHPWILENHRFLLRQMIQFLRQEGVAPIVIRYASIGDPRLQVFSEISSEIAQEEGVLVYDMHSHFHSYGDRIKNLFISSGAHVTPEGATLMAEGLFQTLVEDLETTS